MTRVGSAQALYKSKRRISRNDRNMQHKHRRILPHSLPIRPSKPSMASATLMMESGVLLCGPDETATLTIWTMWLYMNNANSMADAHVS